MNSKMDEFRAFVSRHPTLRDEVRSGKRTWQNIYEEWVLYGEQDTQWQQYHNGSNPQYQNSQPQNMSLMDSVRNIFGYIQRINPDSLNNTLNTVQKAIQIFQTIGSRSSKNSVYMNSPYDEWWD